MIFPQHLTMAHLFPPNLAIQERSRHPLEVKGSVQNLRFEHVLKQPNIAGGSEENPVKHVKSLYISIYIYIYLYIYLYISIYIYMYIYIKILINTNIYLR